MPTIPILDSAIFGGLEAGSVIINGSGNIVFNAPALFSDLAQPRYITILTGGGNDILNLNADSRVFVTDFDTSHDIINLSGVQDAFLDLFVQLTPAGLEISWGGNFGIFLAGVNETPSDSWFRTPPGFQLPDTLNKIIDTNITPAGGNGDGSSVQTLVFHATDNAETFRVDQVNANSRITDFDIGEDHIELVGSFQQFSQLMQEQEDDGLLLSWATGSLFLPDVHAPIDGSWFSFRQVAEPVFLFPDEANSDGGFSELSFTASSDFASTSNLSDASRNAALFF